VMVLAHTVTPAVANTNSAASEKISLLNRTIETSSPLCLLKRCKPQ
jgi:hypothetical protein